MSYVCGYLRANKGCAGCGDCMYMGWAGLSRRSIANLGWSYWCLRWVLGQNGSVRWGSHEGEDGQNKGDTADLLLVKYNIECYGEVTFAFKCSVRVCQDGTGLKHVLSSAQLFPSTKTGLEEDSTLMRVVCNWGQDCDDLSTIKGWCYGGASSESSM